MKNPDKPVLRQLMTDGLPPAALPGAKLLKKFDQNFFLRFDPAPTGGKMMGVNTHD
jgi:hypothetical protein